MALILLQGCSALGSCSSLSQDRLWSAAELDAGVLKLILIFLLLVSMSQNRQEGLFPQGYQRVTSAQGDLRKIPAG